MMMRPVPGGKKSREDSVKNQKREEGGRGVGDQRCAGSSSLSTLYGDGNSSRNASGKVNTTTIAAEKTTPARKRETDGRQATATISHSGLCLVVKKEKHIDATGIFSESSSDGVSIRALAISPCVAQTEATRGHCTDERETHSSPSPPPSFGKWSLLRASPPRH